MKPKNVPDCLYYIKNPAMWLFYREKVWDFRVNVLQNSLKLTCPKSLQYSAKANIAPDSTFQKEIKDIKQTAEQALVNALTRFHKRRLDSLRNKLESRPTFSSRKRTHVNRQSRSESQSASNIVNNDNVKLAELEKRIIDLRKFCVNTCN